MFLNIYISSQVINYVFVIPFIILFALHLIAYLLYWFFYVPRSSKNVSKKTGLSLNFLDASKASNYEPHFSIYWKIFVLALIISASLFWSISALVSLSTILQDRNQVSQETLERFNSAVSFWYFVLAILGTALNGVNILAGLITLKLLARVKSKKAAPIRVDFNELFKFSNLPNSTNELLEVTPGSKHKNRGSVFIRRLQLRTEKRIGKILSKAPQDKIKLEIYKELSKWQYSLWINFPMMNKNLKLKILKTKMRDILIRISSVHSLI
ncbi:hypothetical protein CJJ23_00675 [Mycoplasmopsis agassizii]|uniref:Uncharacterized protein n=1 Tax=Mycoplasmopsis agassizii TaxID=33922 RepID=A0A269TJH9_9BACT|nr:hypothetical protein [Mycoplasmopsis agassizii]PAK21642.1 hypothetical protein CJJ23_00675 [Mycoplasmopsis agassizii]